MKTIAPLLVFVALSFSSLAQTQKVTLYCTLIDNGKVDYGLLQTSLKLIIPDSTIDKILVDPRGQYHIDNSIDALLLMNVSGWKLVSTGVSVRGYHSYTESHSTYLMSREVEMDEKGVDLFTRRLKTSYN